MGFVRYILWLIASFALLATWGVFSAVILIVVDSLFVHTSGPDTTPVWIAYAGLVFSVFVWPALLQLIVHGKKPLGRMVRGWILAFASLNALLGVLMAAGADGADARLGFFGRDISASLDVLLAAALYAASVVVVELYFRRRGSVGGVGLTSAST